MRGVWRGGGGGGVTRKERNEAIRGLLCAADGRFDNDCDNDCRSMQDRAMDAGCEPDIAHRVCYPAWNAVLQTSPGGDFFDICHEAAGLLLDDWNIGDPVVLL